MKKKLIFIISLILLPIMVLTVNAQTLITVPRGGDGTYYGLNAGTYDLDTETFTDCSIKLWRGMNGRILGPVDVMVQKEVNGSTVTEKAGNTLAFNDIKYTKFNGYPIVEADQWQSWAEYLAGNPAYIQKFFMDDIAKQTKKYADTIDNGSSQLPFANLSKLVELCGGQGIGYSAKDNTITYKKTPMPWSSLTVDKNSVTPGTKVTFTIKAKTFSISSKSLRVIFQNDNDGYKFMNGDLFMGDSMTSVRGLTLNTPGTYTFSLKVWDAYQRYAYDRSVKVVVAENPPPVVDEPPPPPPPEVDTNLPPTAIFSLPSECYEGDLVDISESSFDVDGQVVDWDWDHNPNYTGSTHLGQGGGTLTIQDTGKYDVTLTVTDDDGATDTVTHSIQVIAAKPQAVIGYNGTLKENRLVNLYSTNSISSERYPIDHNRDEWTVSPISGGTAADIKWGTRSGASQEMLFKKAGAYRVGLRVHNEKYDSDWAYKDIIIVPDDPPLTNFYKSAIAYRNPAASNYAFITLNDRTFSLDEDNIAERIWKYKYDSNNDESFVNEAWVILDSGNNEKPVLKVNKVGKYLVELSVKESFGQPTIPDFITDSDYRRGDTTTKPQADKIIDVQNIAPVTTFTALVKPVVDISFSQGYLNDFKTRFPSMVNYLAPVAGSKFAAKNIDYAFYNTTAAVSNAPETFYFHSQLVSGSYPYAPENYFGNFYRVHPFGYGYNLVPYEGVNEEYISFDLGKTVNRDDITNFKVLANGQSHYIFLQVSADGVNWSFYDFLWSTWEMSPFNVSKEKSPSKLPLSSFRYIRTENNGWNTDNFQMWITLKGDRTLLQRYFPGSANNSFVVDLGKSYSTNSLISFDIYTSAPFSYSDAAFYISNDGVNWYYGNGGYFGGNGHEMIPIFKTSIPIPSFRYVKAVFGFSGDNTLNFDIITESYSRATLSDIRARANAVYRDNSEKYIVALAEEPFIDADATTLNTTATLLNDKKIGLIVFANNTSLASVQQLTTKLNKQTIIMTPSDLSTAVSQMADWILSKISLTASFGPFYILLGQTLGFNPSYSDYEHDPKVTDNWSYVHDPNFLDNNTGVSFYNNKVLSGPVGTLDKVGKYDVQYNAQDDPSGDLRFLNYRMWSDPNPTTIVVHRKPIANFSVQAGTVYITDLSYDPDFQFKRPDKGIVEWLWKWRSTSSPAWTVGKPSGITAVGTYVIHLEVKDVYGAWSDPVEKTITVTTLQKPPIADFIWAPTLIYEGDAVTLTNKSTDPNNDQIMSQWTIFGPNGSTTNYTFGYKMPALFDEVKINNILPGTYWVTLRVTDPGGMSDTVTKSFVVNILGISGHVKHTDEWNNNRIQYNQYKTGTDDSPRPYNTFWAGEKFVLEASTTDTGISTTKAQTVRADFPAYGLSAVLTPNVTKTYWTGDMFRNDFENIPDGTYTFRFTATYSNGVVKTKDVQVIISDAWDKFYKFHRNW